MICPLCLQDGEEVEMVRKEAVVNQGTDHEQFEDYYECPECGAEDVEGEDPMAYDNYYNR